jgi:hypothetical protein
MSADRPGPLAGVRVLKLAGIGPFGVIQPEPAPRMSRTPGRIQSGPTEPGADSIDVLRTWGFDRADIDRLIADGVVRQPESSH